MSTVKKKKTRKAKPLISLEGFEYSEKSAIEWGDSHLTYELTETNKWRIGTSSANRRCLLEFFRGMMFYAHHLNKEIVDDIHCLQCVLYGMDMIETEEDEKKENRGFFQKVKEDGFF